MSAHARGYEQVLEKVYYWGLVAIFGLIVVHAPLSVYIGSVLPQYALGIKAWKELAMLALALIASFLITRRRLWKNILSDWVIIVALGYILLHLVSLQYGHGILPYVAGLMIDLRFV